MSASLVSTFLNEMRFNFLFCSLLIIYHPLAKANGPDSYRGSEDFFI